MNDIISNDTTVAAWLQVAIKALKIEEREVKTQKFGEFIDEYKSLWEKIEKVKKFKTSYIDIPDIDLEFSKAHFFTIFNNLMINSIYFFNKEKNECVFRFNTKENELVVDFSNNGALLDVKYFEFRNKIFDLSETSKPENEGTGIGLWIVNEIVNLYNGRIEVDRDYNEGFRMLLYIPLKEKQI